MAFLRQKIIAQINFSCLPLGLIHFLSGSAQIIQIIQFGHKSVPCRILGIDTKLPKTAPNVTNMGNCRNCRNCVAVASLGERKDAKAYKEGLHVTRIMSRAAISRTFFSGALLFVNFCLLYKDGIKRHRLSFLPKIFEILGVS